MRKLFIIIFTLFLIGCKPLHQVVVEHVTETHYVDSVCYHDSTVVIPKEVYTNIAWNYDTLILETSLAKAVCYVDSLWLRGNITNKQQVIYKYITETQTIIKDSIVYKEKPVPYEVVKEVKNPVNAKLVWWCVIASLGLLVSLCWIFRKWIIKLLALI